MPAKTLSVPLVPFGQVQGRIARLWDPFERGSFMAVFGTTGSGKSHLIRYGILPLCSASRVVVIDMKAGRDIVWSDFGQPVDELPPAFHRSADPDHKLVWRVVVDRANAQQQLRKVFDQLRNEGHCVVVIDESRSITEREQIGLGSPVENLITEGRSQGISVIMGAQSPAWAVSALKDQAACLWVGKTESQDQAATLAKMAGFGRPLAPVIERIPGRRWLYRDSWEDDRILALTDAPGSAAVA